MNALNSLWTYILNLSLIESTRKFLLMAAIMLTCTNVSAQKAVTLKGDVNGDGHVDVNDVTAIVNLIVSGKTYGYFYLGSTQPTAENYQSLPGVISACTSIAEAAKSSIDVAGGDVVYMLCPTAWMGHDQVMLTDETGETIAIFTDGDTKAIPGYVVCRTLCLRDGEATVALGPAVELPDITGIWNCTIYLGDEVEKAAVTLTSDKKAVESGSSFVPKEAGAWEIKADGSVSVSFSWTGGSWSNPVWYGKTYQGRINSFAYPTTIEGNVYRAWYSINEHGGTYRFVMTRE